MDTKQKIWLGIGIVIVILLVIWGCSWFFGSNGPKRGNHAAADSTAVVTNNVDNKAVQRSMTSSSQRQNADISARLEKISTTIENGDNGIIDAIQGIKTCDGESSGPVNDFGDRGALGNTDTKSSGSGSAVDDYSGNVLASPNAVTFCIYMGNNRFLFWELVNTSNAESIDKLVRNSTGKLANMVLAPGEESSGISFDGNTVKIEISQMNTWYRRIFGVEMPDNFRPYFRGDKTGWGDREMTRTKGYFALTF
jgi:hypothetical protein